LLSMTVKLNSKLKTSGFLKNQMFFNECIKCFLKKYIGFLKVCTKVQCAKFKNGL